MGRRWNLYIHDQLRDMGQNIAMQVPIMNRFVWKSNQSDHFLQKDEVVILLFQSYNLISISYDFFYVKKQTF
jgi:predicted DNA-binding protein (MmcQ/YjbR family)